MGLDIRIVVKAREEEKDSYWEVHRGASGMLVLFYFLSWDVFPRYVCLVYQAVHF